MISQFKLNSELCKSSDVTIFPESDGNCSTYDQTLNTKKDFTNFLNELHSATGSYLKGAPLSVSAHSGGGRTITRMLDAGLTINQVTIFDGIYSEGQKNSLKNWFIKGGGKLFISTVRGMSPENYTQLLKEELGIKMAQTRSTLGGTIFDVFSSEHLTHYSRSTGEVSSLKAHYDVLTQTWPAGN